ncbi:hypothetical protein PENTCL1PPCAC_11904, partial [Pristionchus entomophagus]
IDKGITVTDGEYGRGRSLLDRGLLLISCLLLLCFSRSSGFCLCHFCHLLGTSLLLPLLSSLHRSEKLVGVDEPRPRQIYGRRVYFPRYFSVSHH